MRLLEGRIIWITGASRGIGRATALACLQHGAKVIASARAAQALQEAAQAGAEVLPLDVRDPAALKAAVHQVHKTYRGIDGLVNNAGVLKDALIGTISDSIIDEVLQTNLYGPLRLMQYAARLMGPRGRGSIVNVASIIGRTGNEGQMVYGASKAALIGATKSAARELAKQNIRVNAVAPGVIDTAMISAIPADKLAALQGSIKMGRLGKPEEVADAIVFLLSDMSSYITGQVIGVDGGMWV